MLIFAFLSVPLYVLMVKNKIEFKDISLFFIGIVVSSIISVIFWAFGSLYVLQTHSILVKTIKDYLVYILPLIVVIGFYIFDTKNNLKFNNYYLFSGFIYWNLLFKLLTNYELSNDVLVLFLPIHYLFILFVLQYIDLRKMNIKYINYYLFLGLVFYLFLILLMNFYSMILFSIFSFFVILFFILLIFNIYGLKDFFYDKKNS